jgi:hypothetical protein
MEDNYFTNFIDVIKELEKELKNNHLIYNLTNLNNNKIVSSNNIYYYILNNSKRESIINFKIILSDIFSNFKIQKINNNKTCFDIYEIFDIPNFNKNTIISGKLISGDIETNNEYYINFSKIKVINIHNKNIDCDKLNSGETGCLEIQFIDKITINKTMTIHNDLLNIFTKIYFDIIINKNEQLNEIYDEIIKNKIDEVYIHSKFYNGTLIIENKITEKNNIILKVKATSKVLINSIEFPFNNKALIKHNDNIIFGSINL